MTQAWFDLPEPPEGRMWCVVCVMLGKAQVNTQMNDTVNKLAADGITDRHVRLQPVVPHLELAVVRGLCAPFQQLGVIDLCWTHVAGVELQAVSPLDPRYNGAGNILPGLIKGRG